MSSSSYSDSKKNWLLPEFGINNSTTHSTQKRLKANTPTVVINDKMQHLQYEEELKKGFKKGYDEAVAKATPEINKKLEQVSSLICALNTYKGMIDEKLKEDIYQFVMLVCEKILMEKMQASTDPIANIIRRALEVIETKTLGLKLYCNETLYGHLAQAKLTDEIPHLTLEKDNSLTDYNFRIESDKQFLEFNLKESLKEIIENTKDAFIGTTEKK